MKANTTTTLVAAALVAASTAVLAQGEVLVSGSRSPRPLSLDQRAVNACYSAFYREIMPGSTVPSRTVALPGGTDVFASLGSSLLAPYKVMEVEMTARTHSQELLATSVCIVTRNARVVKLDTSVADPAKLTGLLPKDLRVAMTIH
jgi:hypothetical protein